MTPLWRKLNLKEQSRIVVANAPPEFKPELASLSGVTVAGDPTTEPTIDFALCFVVTQAELDRRSDQIASRARGDAVLWFAYPKKSSRRYACGFNRDTGWDALGSAGFEAVRQVAIDDDWSALRFRRVEYIRSLSRDPAGAISDEGRRRASGRRPPA